MNDPTTLAGYRLANSQVTPTGNTIISGGGADSTLLFGDFSQLCLGFWSELDLRINDQADSVFSKGNALIRAMSTGDVAILQPGAFAAIMGAATA
jgi:hypothetical protein